jgi:signal transduction histidine kinase
MGLDDRERTQLLADVAGAVAWSTDPCAALQRAARLAVPRLADWCALDVVEDDANCRRLAIAHADPRREAQLAPLLCRWTPGGNDAGIARVLRTGRRVVETDVAHPSLLAPGVKGDGERLIGELGAAGYVAVPLRLDAQALGVFTLVTATGSRRLGDADVALAETLARMLVLPLERARLQRELADVSRRQDDILAVLSHELRTPLTAMMAWLQLARHADRDPIERARALATIERNGRALGYLVDELMDTSHIVMRKLAIERRPVDLVEVIETAVSTVSAAARDKGVRLDTELDRAVARHVGDRQRLQQIVGVLLSNAVKFTPPGGRAVVRLSGDAAHVRIQVSDTGRGIRHALLPHVFELFRRGGGSNGPGLGLAIARALTALHDGTIDAESGGEDRGATFTVRLPRR